MSCFSPNLVLDSGLKPASCSRRDSFWCKSIPSCIYPLKEEKNQVVRVIYERDMGFVARRPDFRGSDKGSFKPFSSATETR